MKADWCSWASENTFAKVSVDKCWLAPRMGGSGFYEAFQKNELQPHLLLFDGHTSHLYNTEFLNMMRENIILSLAPHSSHYLQPTGKALFQSLKHHCKLEGPRISRERTEIKFFMPLF